MPSMFHASVKAKLGCWALMFAATLISIWCMTGFPGASQIVAAAIVSFVLWFATIGFTLGYDVKEAIEDKKMKKKILKITNSDHISPETKEFFRTMGETMFADQQVNRNK